MLAGKKRAKDTGNVMRVLFRGRMTRKQGKKPNRRETDLITQFEN